jgi:membrane-associated phospholipid phosphatase
VTRQHAARAVSILLHPFVMMLLGTGAATRRWSTVLTMAAVVAIPFTLYMVRQVRSGRWENVDASRPQERPRLFAFALISLAVMAVVFFFVQSNGPMARGVLGAGAVFVVAWALLRWVKVSLHMACAAMSAVTMLYTAPPLGITIAALLPLLAWSRMRLKRHTLLEIVLGTALGAGAGWALVAL